MDCQILEEENQQYEKENRPYCGGKSENSEDKRGKKILIVSNSRCPCAHTTWTGC